MFCTNCGTPKKEGGKFCWNCGVSFGETPDANPVVTPSASPVVTPSANPVATPSADPVATPSTRPVVRPITNPVTGNSVRVYEAVQRPTTRSDMMRKQLKRRRNSNVLVGALVALAALVIVVAIILIWNQSDESSREGDFDGTWVNQHDNSGDTNFTENNQNATRNESQVNNFFQNLRPSGRSGGSGRGSGIDGTWEGPVMQDLDGNKYTDTLVISGRSFTYTYYSVIEEINDTSPPDTHDSEGGLLRAPPHRQPTPPPQPGADRLFSINTGDGTIINTTSQNHGDHWTLVSEIIRVTVQGTISLTENQIEFVTSDNTVIVFDLSSTENTMTLERGVGAGRVLQSIFVRSGMSR